MKDVKKIQEQIVQLQNKILTAQAQVQALTWILIDEPVKEKPIAKPEKIEGKKEKDK